MTLEELVKTDKPTERDWAFAYAVISKTRLVEGINEVFKKQDTSIEKIELKIFVNKDKLKEGHRLTEEYVVVTYKGGSIAVANNCMNSVTATYRNIGLLLNGGYYDQVKTYNDYIINSGKFEEVIVEKPHYNERINKLEKIFFKGE